MPKTRTRAATLRAIENEAMDRAEQASYIAATPEGRLVRTVAKAHEYLALGKRAHRAIIRVEFGMEATG